jgi:hypothetical protein
MSKKNKQLDIDRDRICECNLNNTGCKCEVETDCYDHGLGTCPKVHLCPACGHGEHFFKGKDERYEPEEWEEGWKMFA